MRARLRPIWRPLIAATILLATIPPPFAAWWEGAMVRHMLGQIPLLVLAGALLVPKGLPRGSQAQAIAAILVAGFCITFWMIPRWLDAAINARGVDLIKIATLALLAGVPIGWGWPRLAPLARGFVFAQLASMFAVLGSLYLIAPLRLCNNYLVDDQTQLGRAALVIAAAIVLSGLISALAGGGITRVRPPPA